MKYKIMDGNEACAYASYPFTEVCGIYPITPSSTMAELVDEWSKSGKKNFFGEEVNVEQMQSEAGAAGMIHGASQSGCLATTYTASQGLLLMIPNMYKIAGEQLPVVIHVASRSIATHALSIFGDHQDIYATRMTGFAILSSSSPQQVMDLTPISHLAAIKGKVPFLNFFDGFRTSHELQKIEPIDLSKVKKLIDKKSLQEFRNKALNINKPVTRGTSQNDDIYFQNTEVRNPYYLNLPDIVNDYMKEISNITGRSYAPFVYHGSTKATKIIVAMGSVSETIKETVDYLNEQDESKPYGFIEVHLYRPFSSKYFLDVLPKTVKSIAVLDRTKEPGSVGEPLYLDVKSIIDQVKRKIRVIGGRYGLSSKNTNPSCIKAVFDFLDKKDNFTGFTVGIDDDLTCLSLPIEDFSLPNDNTEFIVYGYGSDGMVSACKDLMKITGDNTNAYVQGYFQYDSKKSGGVTKSHLRFGKNPILSTYYVEKPSLIVCTKDSYLKKWNVLENIQENGIFLLNTDKTEEEILNFLSKEDLKILKKKNITFYIADCLSLSKKIGLDNKISTIMETLIFKVAHLIPFLFAKAKIKENITKKFIDRSNNIVNKNIEAIDNALDLLKEVSYKNYPLPKTIKKQKEELSIFEMIDTRRGDQLKVSDFENLSDGTFEKGLSKLEKRKISSFAPCFIKENCIQCNLCSLVCPHAVIRPYLLNDLEYEKAPRVVKDNIIKTIINKDNMKYIVSVSLDDCTGCKLCVNICPGKKGNKALTMESIDKLMSMDKDKEIAYLMNNVKEKRIFPISTVKGSQFRIPKFEFSGACSGCGETPYLKLLTQLFGDNLVISNATGCSSIYGASAPSTPYSVSWANSLFEDNAEYGYGMKIADNMMKKRIKSIIKDNIDKLEEDSRNIYLNYVNDFNKENAENLYNIIDETPIKALKNLKDFIKHKSIWMVGGDGWAYDIGFSGIDHVLANNENVNILVLDTEVYSNTGGQSSKATKLGTVTKFNSKGKDTNKKDLVKIALTYPHVYVGTISLGANPNQAIKVLMEAENYNGPSIVIAYSPCIAQGILKGMENAMEEEKKATSSGYFPLIHYNPETKIFSLDSKANFDSYYEFLLGEDRYYRLKNVNPTNYKKLLEANKKNAVERYSYYEKLEQNSKVNNDIKESK